jgi:hypothetical protein
MMASELTANCVDRNLSAKTIDWLADRVGFELAVLLAKFGFEISTEFPAAFAQFAFKEIPA